MKSNGGSFCPNAYKGITNSMMAPIPIMDKHVTKLNNLTMQEENFRMYEFKDRDLMTLESNSKNVTVFCLQCEESNQTVYQADTSCVQCCMFCFCLPFPGVGCFPFCFKSCYDR